MSILLMEQTTSEFFKNFDLRNSDRKSTSVLGNLESNFYLLDTDGHQGVQSPFQGFCQFPEGLTIIGNIAISVLASQVLGFKIS